MSDCYAELLDRLSDHDQPHQTLTLQLCFILYLVLGQLAALLLWRLAVPRCRPSWRANAAFGLYLLAAQVALLLGWPRLVGAWQRADNFLLADLVVISHVALVVAVLAVLLLLPGGPLLGWAWTRNFWLRLTHLVVIEVVAGQAVVGIECPLKTVERHLRGGPEQLHNFAGSGALGRWCNEVLYYRGEPWVFLAIYLAVGALVLLTWVLIPPRLPWVKPEGEGQRAGDEGAPRQGHPPPPVLQS